MERNSKVDITNWVQNACQPDERAQSTWHEPRRRTGCTDRNADGGSKADQTPDTGRGKDQVLDTDLIEAKGAPDEHQRLGKRHLLKRLRS